ncbi:MAG: cytochrome c oxidase assembly protein [Acidimicrobiales bacterium]|jgi:putative copper resistance protein D
MQLPPFWQVTPIGLVAVVLGIAHEMGLRWLALRQIPEHRRATRRRSWAFYAGLVGLIVVVSGPLERWSMAWLSVHMVLHVLEMFYLPPLLIVGAPWVPLLFAVPVDQRRRLLRSYYRSPWAAPLRGAHAAAANPIVAIVLFNGVMVVWHLPRVFDWASDHNWVMNWLMAPSFIVVGLLFWRIILPSHPWGPRGSTRIQIGAIVVTALEMLVLAMAMAIFTKAPWYSMNVLMDGPAAALRDQRYAAGVLWVCGDFWAIPALVLVGYRVYGRDGGVSASFERVLGRV